MLDVRVIGGVSITIRSGLSVSMKMTHTLCWDEKLQV